MTQAPEYGDSRELVAKVPRKSRGFTIMETMLVVVIGTILTAMAAPQVVSGMNWYRLRGAVASATWAVQSTRYQALMAGYPYQVVFTKATNSYQIQNLPAGAATYANVGGVVPLSGSNVALNQDTTVRFSPNGSVSAPVGSLTFILTFNGNTATTQVSTYGNVNVKYTP